MSRKPARASLIDQLRATMTAGMAQEKRLEIAQARYNTGLISYLEVLDAQRDMVTARQSVANVQHAQLEAEVQLYKALGGGAQGGAQMAEAEVPHHATDK